MKQSRKMVLISEDEYAQLHARTKPTEDVTESSVREHNNTAIKQLRFILLAIGN